MEKELKWKVPTRFGLDLQFFADGAEGEGEGTDVSEDDFSFESLLGEFGEDDSDDSEEGEDEDLSVDDELGDDDTDGDDSEDEDTGDDSEGEDEDEDEGADDDADSPPAGDDDARARDAAFAKLRRQAEEAQAFKDFVQELSTAAGVSPEELMEQFKEKQIETEAKEKSIPVDVYKRLNALEQENQEMKQRVVAERFDSDVKALLDDGATEEEVREAMQYAADNGIDLRLGTVSIKQMYKLAHMDKIIAKKAEEAKQDVLSKKRERQRKAAVPNGSGASAVETFDDDYVDKTLKDMGLMDLIEG